MSEKPSPSVTNKNSQNEYISDQWQTVLIIFDVVVGFAITEGLSEIIKSTSVFSWSWWTGEASLFLLVFFLFAIRFATWAHELILIDVEAGASPVKKIIDSVALLLQALIFYVAAISCNAEKIITLAVCLIAISAVDLCWAKISLTKRHADKMPLWYQKTAKFWMYEDIGVIIFVVGAIVLIHYCDWSGVGLLVFISGLAAVHDFYRRWKRSYKELS